MRQLIQHLKSGKTELKEIARPTPGPSEVLIRTRKSLVSLGTERTAVEFGRASLVAKARQQPERVQQVLSKIRAEGLMPTVEAVFRKLGQPIPLGYCNVGEVVGLGHEVEGLALGDRVASNGAHAEYVCVPKNLVAKIPSGVNDLQAGFTVVGAIALQALRLADLKLGETVVVIGLGLVGQLAAQLAVAHGCRVIGVDIDESKLALLEGRVARLVNSSGCDPVKAVLEDTGERGADAVIIAASAKTDAIMAQAAQMSRRRGRLILLGVVGLNLNRADFYEKELSFQVSCSYGPGRYDAAYEQKGLDYPFGLVRWTAQRNFEAVLEMMQRGSVEVEPLITREVAFDDFDQIYDHLSDGGIANVLSYSTEEAEALPSTTRTLDFQGRGGYLALIGAGNFSRMTLLPSLPKASLRWIVSAGGLSATLLAEEYGVPKSSSRFQDVLEDQEVKAVVVATRHKEHAEMVVEALKAGKDVFVEKPLALDESELEAIGQAYRDSGRALTVGFNRRFAPLVERMRSLIDQRAPKNLIMTVNAGHIPPDLWVHDPELGGGRVIGEGCHFFDLLSFLSGSPIEAVCSSCLGTPGRSNDNVSTLLKFANGDQGTVHYLANGHKAASKERLEVFWDGRILMLDNFRELKGYGVPGFSKEKSRLDKGHRRQFELLVERMILGGQALIPFDSLVNTTRASFAAIESLKTGGWISVK